MAAMRLIAAAVAVGAVTGGLVAVGDATPRRRGKVVRIARQEPAVSTRLRYCQLYDIEVGGCSREVKVGDVGWVMDNEGTYGQARIVDASPVVDACGQPISWNITIDLGQLIRRDFSAYALLVLDHEVTESAHLLPTSEAPPAARAGEVVAQIIDDDGDDRGDVMITTFPCDGRGGAPSATGSTHQCTDYWIERRDEWRHARTDVVVQCRR